MYLTVVIITYNEIKNLTACLESVQFADEVIVIDSGSTDGTPELGEKLGAKVLRCDWPGDGPQRNRGIAMAQGKWVLILDADERVSLTLQKEIQHLDDAYDGYDIPFQSHYLGKAIRYGDWRGEHHIRLFKKGKGMYSTCEVHGAQGAHCKPVVDGKVGILKGVIEHHPFPTLERMLQKLNEYSSGSAALKVHRGKKGGVWRALGHGLWAFIRGYIIRAGFLDGREGFILATSNAQGAYYRYLKMFYIGKNHATH